MALGQAFSVVAIMEAQVVNPDGYGRGLETSGPPVGWKAEDFVHWSFDGTYFPAAATEKYWAPSKVVQANGK